MKFKKLIPTFIPFAYELIHIYKRNAKHDQNIRKKDRTAEKIGSLEHLMVRLEKKVQQNDQVLFFSPEEIISIFSNLPNISLPMLISCFNLL